MKKTGILIYFIFLLAVCTAPEQHVPWDQYPVFSGIYPHLAYYNNEGECGTGAVVPWQGDLWVVTYGPHLPYGSSDKLCQITPELQQIIRPESIGGTPANRMVHRESNQLFIGPYAIDAEKNVRTIPYGRMPGRHTGNARHLTDPENMIYYGTMEEGFYEVNVHTLEVNTLFSDGNRSPEEQARNTGSAADLLPGAHGKGLYSGQGVLVYSNNGERSPEALKQFDIESGALAEWDGEHWKVVRRNQFVEVTGPGGIWGNANPDTDPIWATGWDHKSLLLGVRHHTHGWAFYRLPKSSHSYDGAHGWNTEWPRIRDVGTAEKPEYLMTMHGMFWTFPETFAKGNTAGIRPRSAYLKVIGDFARWMDRLVFGCDDSAQREFLNKRAAKGGIEGPGQSNSNLWFTSFDQPDNLGPSTTSGAVWLEEGIAAGEASEPFLFAGWSNRTAWVHNSGKQRTTFFFQVDNNGEDTWSDLQSVALEAGSSVNISFSAEAAGEWIRVVADRPGMATVQFAYTEPDTRSAEAADIFAGLSGVEQGSSLAGLLYGLGDDRRALGLAAVQFDGEAEEKTGYYELNAQMELVRKEDPETESFIRERFAIPREVVHIDDASVLVVDDLGRRWRLPFGHGAYTDHTANGALRIAREVATERDLFSCHGTFYELPAENADGFAKIRPVASHDYRIHDYASYRGMLIMTGIEPGVATGNPHIVRSQDGRAAVWAGVIDDLWKMGKPTGHGGPWKDTRVKPGVPSDPYLIGFYDEKQLTLSHDQDMAVTFTLEVDPVGHGPWMAYKKIEVAPGQKAAYSFPADFQARWIRLAGDKDCAATAWFEYK
jgi:hypothetical protein